MKHPTEKITIHTDEYIGLLNCVYLIYMKKYRPLCLTTHQI